MQLTQLPRIPTLEEYDELAICLANYWWIGDQNPSATDPLPERKVEEAKQALGASAVAVFDSWHEPVAAGHLNEKPYNGSVAIVLLPVYQARPLIFRQHEGRFIWR